MAFKVLQVDFPFTIVLIVLIVICLQRYKKTIALRNTLIAFDTLGNGYITISQQDTNTLNPYFDTRRTNKNGV